MRALLSVDNKEGLIDLAHQLTSLGVELYASGRTHAHLTDAGLSVCSIADLTHFPEILDGRVKTLHPAIHGGILADRDNPAHMQTLADHQMVPFDIVIVNLYPFVETVSSGPVDLATAIEKIDIGGVALIRAAAKNHVHVLVAVDPADYPALLADVQRRSGHDMPVADTAADDDAPPPPAHLGQRLAAKAFTHTALYDSYVSAYLHSLSNESFPDTVAIPLRKVRQLRYGENPHQAAAFYTTVPTTEHVGLRTLATARQIHGKELSFNNLLDLDAAWTTVRDFQAPTAVIVKHTNPCGLGCAADLPEAYQRAFSGDPVASYGGIVGFNRVIDAETAQLMRATFFEAVVAPDVSEEAMAILSLKRDLRVIVMGERSFPRKGEFGWLPDNKLDFKRITGGFIVQQRNALTESDIRLTVVTKRGPTLEELTDLKFAWRAVKHVKSNAIVLAKQLTVIGVGAGQMKRVDSVDLAVRHASDRAAGAVLASDAYFPFADGVQRALDAGVTAIIQPGGSIRDQQSIDEADRIGAAMVFTGVRHFKH